MDKPTSPHLMSTEAIEDELNALGCALKDGEECSHRMHALESELRERYGVNAAAAAVISERV